MEITKEQDEAIRTMRAEAAHVNDLRKKLESSETKLTSKAKEFFKEVFGTGIETRPIFVFDRSTLGFQAESIKADTANGKGDNVYIYGHLCEYTGVKKEDPDLPKLEAVFSLSDLMLKSKRVFKDYLAWVRALKDGLPIKSSLLEAQKNLKEAEERLRDSKETIYSIIETWIKDFYKVEVKRGTVILFHPTPDYKEIFEVKDFAFDNDSGLILVKGEVIGWRNTLVIPIYELVPKIKEVYLNMEDYKAYTLSGERK